MMKKCIVALMLGLPLFATAADFDVTPVASQPDGNYAAGQKAVGLVDAGVSGR